MQPAKFGSEFTIESTESLRVEDAALFLAMNANGDGGYHGPCPRCGQPGGWMGETSSGALTFSCAKGCTPDAIKNEVAERHRVAVSMASAMSPPGTGADDDAEIARLAKLDTIAYERERTDAAAKLDVRASVLDRLVSQARTEARGELDDTAGQGKPLELQEREPWHEPVAGDQLLEAIVGALLRYVIMPFDLAAAVTLWIVASYAAELFYIFPRLNVRSPEKGCGKSTLLDFIECVTNRPLIASNIKSAALFRSIEMARPTMILDEADTFMKDDEDLRGVVDSGHKRNGAVVRCVGDDAEPRQFSTFSPMVIAGIGRQHETIEDRSIIITLRRKRPDEPVESFRPDRAPHLLRLARMAARFAEDSRAALSAADPDVPEGIFNRQADNWRPLFAVADVAGGRWPMLARKIAASMAAVLGGDTSVRVILLSDIRDIFTISRESAMSSAALVDALKEMEGRPWGEWRNGKPITPTGLARLLAAFPISPSNGRFDGVKVTKGYKRSQFEDEFARYLPPMGNRTVQPLQTAENLGFEPDHHPLQAETCSGSLSGAKPQESAICSDVADENPQPDQERDGWTF